MTALFFGFCAGVAATVTMDLSASVARRIGLVRGAKGIWVGRWYLGLARGQLVHEDIALTPERAGEKRAALVGHYAIGIALAVVYFIGADRLGASPSSFPIAIGYGLATCVFPWFLLFPCFGYGWLGLKGPKELRMFSSSVMNHLFYGLGLWWIALVLQLAR